jgi:hypothetical protein
MLEIYFRDLAEEKQKELLEFYEYGKPEDGNWDIAPICVIEKGEEYDQVRREKGLSGKG